MARCKHCGVYIEPEEGVDVDPNTCDDCWRDYTEYPVDYHEPSDADPGL